MRTIAAAILTGLAVFVLASCEPAPVEPAPFVPQREIADIELKPWPEAVSVRLFVEAEERTSDGDRAYVRPQGQRLSAAQRAEFERNLRLISFDKAPDAAMACFVPHHFLRYYDASGEQIGELSICFCCAEVQAKGKPTTAAMPEGATYQEIVFLNGLKSAIANLGYSTEIGCDAV